MKEVSKKFSVNGKEYELVFNLNVMEEIQDEYGTLDKWGALTDGKSKNGEEPDIKALIFGVTAMLNEAIDIANEKIDDKLFKQPFLTKKQVGRLLSEMGVDDMQEAMQEVVIESAGSNGKNA